MIYLIEQFYITLIVAIIIGYYVGWVTAGRDKTNKKS